MLNNARMAERKFSKGLSKPGMAAQLRESVSQVVRETTVQVFKIYNMILFNLLKFNLSIE